MGLVFTTNEDIGLEVYFNKNSLTENNFIYKFLQKKLKPIGSSGTCNIN